MKTITIQIDESEAKNLLAIYRKEYAELSEALDLKGKKIRNIESMLNESTDITLPLTISSKKTPSGRRTKGENRKLIKSYLQTKKDTGARLNEIAKETGIFASTALRNLSVLTENGVVTKKDELWFIL